ncbi:isocitrate lyase/PEP mutase family protein [Streptacidiphilus albus]|uniref:isocitrate lyase/PEP mutase family protein n=1 Tax=Streptacidiphilus albus TaxID=105425 RepID=UPI00054B5D9D|nr:isocitrate lyase/phosphoenolpyruvate mutase family protein [Streptacidiphilus albus]
MNTSFHALHHGDLPLLLPNAWDFASGAALAAAGFAAIGTTSLGVAAANGLPDAAGLARDETVALARRLVRLPCPVTVDIEAGFSADPEEVGDLVAELAEVGIAGVNLEDGRGDHLADPGAQAALVRAVKRRAPEVFLNARTDTYWLDVDASVPATLERLRRYVDAGADGVFVPGLAGEQDIRAVTAAVPVPVNLLHRPGLGLDRLAELGVRRVSTGSLLFRAALQATVTTAVAVREGGPLPAGIPGYAEVDALSR